MNQERKVHLETKVMKKIKDEKINFRSRYIFLAKKLGLGGGLTLSLILAALFLNLAFFSMRVSGSLEFLSFGRIGILAFLESFPYHWILIELAFFTIASAILSRYDLSYKKPFKLILSVLIVLILIAGIVLAISGLNEAMEEKVAQGKLPLLQSFYRRRQVWKNGLVGTITEIKREGIVIETSEKKRVFIELTKDTLLPGGPDFKIGDRIRAVGEWDGEDFRASALQPTNKGRRLMGGVTKGNGKAEPGPLRTHQ